MKILLLFTALLLWCGSANSQNPNKRTKKNEQTMEHISQFDTSRFNSKRRYSSTPNELEFTDISTEFDGTMVRQTFWGPEDGYVEIRLKANSLFKEYRYFYANGKIRVEHLRFWNSSLRKGGTRYYDTTGKLLNEKNDDPLYKFTWEKLVQFTRQNNCDLYDEYTIIGRGMDDEFKKNVWYIEYRPTNEGRPLTTRQRIKSIILDGKTGKVLKDEWTTSFANETPYPNVR